jgi:hypothetical protein
MHYSWHARAFSCRECGERCCLLALRRALCTSLGVRAREGAWRVAAGTIAAAQCALNFHTCDALPLLLCAQDLAGALKAAEIAELLDLGSEK